MGCAHEPSRLNPWFAGNLLFLVFVLGIDKDAIHIPQFLSDTNIYVFSRNISCKQLLFGNRMKGHLNVCLEKS